MQYGNNKLTGQVFYDIIDTINRDSTLNARSRFAEGHNTSKAGAIIGFVYYFLKGYFRKGKYINRFVSGLFSGLEEFLTCLKLLKLKGKL